MLDKTDGRILAGDWTDERMTLLKTLWASGDSASIIGAALGVSRSAVLGKVHRIGLEGRRTISIVQQQHRGPPTLSRQEKARRQAERRALREITKTQPLPEPAPISPDFLNLSFDQLAYGDKKCRYPAGDERPMVYCGQPTIKGTSWCLHCYRVVCAPRRAA